MKKKRRKKWVTMLFTVLALGMLTGCDGSVEGMVENAPGKVKEEITVSPEAPETLTQSPTIMPESTATPEPTATPNPTATPEPTATPTPKATATPTPAPTPKVAFHEEFELSVGEEIPVGRPGISVRLNVFNHWDDYSWINYTLTIDGVEYEGYGSCDEEGGWLKQNLFTKQVVKYVSYGANTVTF